ncbi:right-handed parallel beta-helix repeat-containing protein [Paucidesulfovibrio longus]|uniref:glycosyl hydrolase family 28-related protein n=1 Tax=Paucidesulfovibrio longus TaxID=889 RepID=UPI0003B7518B|nr:glycosyl hydrolase family 28-related protein [Paucidesulfovibrio longus]
MKHHPQRRTPARLAPATAKLMAAVLPVLLTAVLCGCLGSASDSRPSDSRTSPTWTPKVWTEYLLHGPTGQGLPDFSQAGYAQGDAPLPQPAGPIFDADAAPFRAVPDDGQDDTAAIQAAADAAGAAGGGVVLLPRGRLLVHSAQDGPILRLSRNNVVLRGRGSGADGTILRLGAPGPAGKVRRLGSVPGQEEARRFAAVSVLGDESGRELARVTRDAERGARELSVSDASALRPGMFVVVECDDGSEEAAGNLAPPAPDAPDLPARLTRPFRLLPEQSDTFGPLARRLSWIALVEAVPDARTVRLRQPLRFDLLLRYAPRISSFEGVREVGVEHLRIESAWPGGYRHHKPYEENGVAVRSAREQDYLWNGVWISGAANCWVRDVVFRDLTQGVILSRAAHVSVEDVRFEGHDGHAGVTFGWSNDNLLARAVFQGRLVHPVTVTMTASGNVVTDCETRYQGTDPVSGTSPAIDLHGYFPYENLFENLRGFNVVPGGDLSVMPHGGVRNVFWNVTAPTELGGYPDWGGDSFVQTWAYASTSSGTPATMHEHLPQAFYVGVRREGGELSLGGSRADRRDQWMTVEGLNRAGLALPSLFQAQRALRSGAPRPAP